MATKHKFPTTLYARFEDEGGEDEWLRCEEDPDDLLETDDIDKEVKMGHYQLVGITRAVLAPDYDETDA